MASKQIKELPAEVQRVRGQLDEWRGRRPHRQRIPAELWSAAAHVARRHGVNCVSCALGLDYYQLKRRCGQYEEKDESLRGAEGVFVELEAVQSETGTRCAWWSWRRATARSCACAYRMRRR